MKSIKEKAEEVYPGHCNAYTDAHNIIKRMGFKAGANYVISCIEKEMLSCKEFSQSQLRLIMQFCEQLEVTNK